MKLLGLLIVCLLAITTYAQEGTKKEVRKEVRMEENNGEKVLTIITEENGTVTEEVFTGDEAETMLDEMMDGNGPDEGVKKEIEVEIINGEKTVTITTIEGGQVRKEKYIGEDADAKLKELQESEPQNGAQPATRTIKKTESEIIEQK